MINGSGNSVGQPDNDAIPHSGYAALAIVLSYFEMIAKYRDGYAQRGRSKHYFNEGVRSVFNRLAKYDNAVVDPVLDALYDGGRCGLYHAGMTDSRIMLTGELDSAMGFDPARGMLIINPHLLVPALLANLGAYIDELRNPANEELRTNFETRFDFEAA